MGVEVKGPLLSEDAFEDMKTFVRDYLEASLQNEDDGGRMRWYPWHSATYRFNHTLNVVDLATEIASAEGADPTVVKVAALFHDVAKLEVEQDRHADVGAAIAREYLESHGDYPESFIEQVTTAIKEHADPSNLADLSPETRSLIEADMLDKVGANGATLMLLRMGYEGSDHLNAVQMIQRVIQRGLEVSNRVESETAESLAHQRLKRARWFQEWLESEVVNMDREPPADEDPRPGSSGPGP